MRGPVSWGALALVGGTGIGLAVYYNMEKERLQSQSMKKQSTYGTPSLGGPWTLVSSKTGTPVTDASYHGKYTLLYFGFSRCPDICPAELVKIGDVLSLVEGKGPEVQALFVSLDPQRDSLEQLRHYAQDFDKRIEFLVGTPEQLTVASKRYRVYSTIGDGDPETSDDYLIDHSIVLYLCGPDGKFLDFFTQSTNARDVAARIINHAKDAS